MIGAFLYLTLCSMRNKLRVRLQRLREPRYLAGMIFGLMYLYRFVFRNLFRGTPTGRGPGTMIAVLTRVAGPVQMVGSLILFVLAAAVWLLPGFKPPLTFSRAEVQFLFQAPLSRRQLVHYKLIRSQAGALFGSAMMTLFMRPPSLVAGLMLLTGIWLLFSTMSLHAMGISLSRESLSRRPVAGFASMWVMVAVAAGAIGVLGFTVVRDWAHLASLLSPGEVFHEVEALMSNGAAGLVLWPFRAMVRVPLAQTPAEFRQALPAALLIAAANYVWVIRADASFEEASAEHAEKAVAQLATRSAPAPRVRAGASATPFTLSLAGRPEIAILWKNLIMLGRYASLKTLLRFLPIIVVFGLMSKGGGHARGVLTALTFLCAIGLGLTVLLGPQMARNDLRQDLGNLAVLKTWPLRGATLLRGELLAPLALLTAIAWLLILAVLMLSGQIPMDGAMATQLITNRVPYAAAAMLAAPALILAQLVVQNGFAIAFPAWAAIGVSRARGVEIMGQRMLMLAGNLIVLALSILPAAIIAALVAGAAYLATHTISVVMPALIMAAVMIAECWLAVEALGRVLDRTDVNAVDARE
jgi:ABC-2 type transport system permease protein